jgi:hypothetical protein
VRPSPFHHRRKLNCAGLTVSSFREQLSLNNIHVNETDAVSDQELLIDIMEAREAIDEARSEEEVEELRDVHRGASP